MKRYLVIVAIILAVVAIAYFGSIASRQISPKRTALTLLQTLEKDHVTDDSGVTRSRGISTDHLFTENVRVDSFARVSLFMIAGYGKSVYRSGVNVRESSSSDAVVTVDVGDHPVTLVLEKHGGKWYISCMVSYADVSNCYEGK